MINDPELTRQVISYECPACHAQLHICQAFRAETGLLWVITSEQMQANKAKLKELLKTATFDSKEEEEKTMAYIDSDQFALGENDVEVFARDIMKGQ